MRILNDKKERSLLVLALFSFASICLFEMKLPLPMQLNNSLLGTFFVAEATGRVILGLLYGIVSAYIFYIFIDYLPRIKREEKTIGILNLLIASILDAYNRTRIFGHETSIAYVKDDILNKNWIEDNIGYLQDVLNREEKERVENIYRVDSRVTFLKLKFAMQTAYTRLEDFRHSLPLAATLSPERVKQWLVIIDKIRLLAENYGSQPDIPNEKSAYVDTNSDDNPIRDYRLSLVLRVLEILEESLVWLFPVS